MKIVKLLLLILILHSSGNLFTQVQQEWVVRRDMHMNNDDYVRSMVIDIQGNIYVTGRGSSYTFATLKINSEGIFQWSQNYEASITEARSIAVDNQGNVYITGWSYYQTDGYDYLTIKYNSAGVQQWFKRYNGASDRDDRAFSIVLDNENNIYVTGYSFGDSTNSDYVTIKYNTNGNELWIQRYNGIGFSQDEAYSIAIDNLNNVYITGLSKPYNGLPELATVKYNSSGAQQWVQRANGSAISVKTDNTGNVYVIGSGDGDYITIKYNSGGVQQWLKKYNGPANNNDLASSMSVDNSGNVYVTGKSKGVGGTNAFDDYATVKYNSSGTEVWSARYNGAANRDDRAKSIAVDNSGNVYVTGESQITVLDLDFTTLKYNSSGIEQWVKHYNGPRDNGYDEAVSIAVDISGNVYVSGISDSIGTQLDYTIIKYSQPNGITPISTEIPNEFNLGQNYPNPFNPATNINFQLPTSGFVNLVVFDMLGRAVETLVDQNLNVGTYKVDWNASKYSSGIYYYRIMADDFTETKKMVLIK